MVLRSHVAFWHLFVISLLFCSVHARVAAASIDLRLLDADTGSPVAGAVAMGYWSKEPPANPACIAGALFGLPVHCARVPVTIVAVEAVSNESGLVSLPDSENRGWISSTHERLLVHVFKDRYRTAWLREIPPEPEHGLCLSEQQVRDRANGAIPVLLYPMNTGCRNYDLRKGGESTDAERRWDIARAFASYIKWAVVRAEDKQALVAQLPSSIEAADAVLFPPPPTRKYGPWDFEEVWPYLRQIRRTRGVGE